MYTVERYSFLETIKTQRLVKEEGKGISLHGFIGQSGERFYDETERLLSDLIEENPDFKEKYVTPLKDGYLSEINPEMVDSIYMQGLRSYIKLQYRMYSKTQDIDTVFSREYIRDIIIGYTHDFVMNIRLSKKLGVSANVALNIAKLSYRNNPTTLSKLMILYPYLNDGIILKAVERNPIDPEKYLLDVLFRIQRLENIYPEVDSYIIKKAAVSNPNNPEIFLDGVLDRISRLTEMYPDLDNWIIKFVAVRKTKDPEQSINEILRRVSILQNQYPGVTDEAIIRVAVKYTSDNTRAAMERYIHGGNI